MNSSLSAPIWIDSSLSLNNLCAELARQPRIAVDTEANSLHSYQEQVCLIQFSTPETDFLVDPLALHDLTPLGDIFSNERIEKVFHAAEYDLIGLQRDFSFTFSNLFDTMQAARILGYKQVGLGNLLAEKFNLVVDKRFQKADWGARPLSPSQVDYARQDTHSLLALRDLLEAELRQRERWALAQEDFSRSCFVTNGNHPAKERWERIDSRHSLNTREQTILNELCLWRETAAEKLDRPVFKVMDDRSLLKLAQETPRSFEELAAAGLTPRQIERFGKTLLDAIQRGKKAPEVHATATIRPPDSVLNRLNLLKTWRKQKGEQLGVESDIILPRSYLFNLAEKNPRTIESLAHLMADSPWRLQQFGPEILQALGVKGLIKNEN